MSENKFDEFENMAQNEMSEEISSQQTENRTETEEIHQVKELEDISSGRENFTENVSPRTPQPAAAPIQMNGADYNDHYYENPYNNYNNYNTQPAAKKSGKAKKAALIAGALALTLCIGVGGGFLGSYLANHQPETVISSGQTATSSNIGTSEDNMPALQIIQASNTETPPTTTQEVAEKVKDAVVEITTETTTYDTFYGQYVSKGAGSGVIISTDGYIITNNHVIEDAQTITVRLTDEKSYTAKLIGTDAKLDVALLKIEAENLTAVTFGTSSNLKVGQTAIAIGNPLGQLGGTVTDGIISALDREIEVDGTSMTLLQTNAAINPGNSGGGLFDANGNLIGMVVAKSSSTSGGTSLEGLGFAIPVDNIVNILSDLKSKGYVTGRAYLGVTIVDVSDSNTAFMYRLDRTGVYISSVEAGGAAEKAGLQAYDCITKIGDTSISVSTDVSKALSKLKAGDTVKITVIRDGEEKVLDVTLGESVPNTSKNTQNNNSGNYGYFGRGNNGSYFGSYYSDDTESSNNI